MDGYYGKANLSINATAAVEDTPERSVNSAMVGKRPTVIMPGPLQKCRDENDNSDERVHSGKQKDTRQAQIVNRSMMVRKMQSSSNNC